MCQIVRSVLYALSTQQDFLLPHDLHEQFINREVEKICQIQEELHSGKKTLELAVERMPGAHYLKHMAGTTLGETCNCEVTCQYPCRKPSYKLAGFVF